MTNLGAQLLWRWMSDKELKTQYEACKWFDCHPVQFNRWLKGHAVPGRKWAVIIEKVTLGQVTCGSWDDDPLPMYEIDPVTNPDFDYVTAIYKHKSRKGQ